MIYSKRSAGTRKSKEESCSAVQTGSRSQSARNGSATRRVRCGVSTSPFATRPRPDYAR